MYQFALPRREPIREGELTLVPAGPMGVATSINFQPTGGGKAAITGDFVLAANEVNPVIKALRENEIEVTAVHSHMLAEQPRLFFMIIFGPMTRRSSWLKACGPPLIRSHSPETEQRN